MTPEVTDVDEDIEPTIRLTQMENHGERDAEGRR